MESSNFSENHCVIGLGGFSTSTEKVTVVSKGIPSLIEFCKIRGDTLLQDDFESKTNKNQWVECWYIQNVVVHT